MSDNYILDYQHEVDTKTPIVQKVLRELWDETGRSREENTAILATALLLDAIDSFKEFLPLYIELFSMFRSPDDEMFRLAREHYHLYIRGMKRIVDSF